MASTTDVFEITLRPPKDKPQTFEDDYTVINPSTNEEVTVKQTREYIRHMTVRAANEEEAKFIAERTAFDWATGEHQSFELQDSLAKAVKSGDMSEEDATREWNNLSAIRTNLWVVEKVEKSRVIDDPSHKGGPVPSVARKGS